jgi:hypothetical protein
MSAEGHHLYPQTGRKETELKFSAMKTALKNGRQILICPPFFLCSALVSPAGVSFRPRESLYLSPMALS